MKRVGRVAKWLLLGATLVVLLLLSPVLYVETACRGPKVEPSGTASLLPPEHRRSEARTLMTYPEWHIVHAYDDYARVTQQGAPHDYAFLRAIGQFWGTYCDLAKLAPHHGGADADTRLTIHVIGVSFTAEMLLKALYEESLGRAAYTLFGRGPLDDVAARQSAEYAAFLRQVPWYRWDFAEMAEELTSASTGSARDRERSLALGLEYGAKAAYAGVIAGAVAATGADDLTLRSVLTGAAPSELSRIDGVTVIGPRGPGVEIETPRYAAFTDLLPELARTGARFVEIAGNDEIMLTLTGPDGVPGAFETLPRQGYGDLRSLLLTPVGDLLDILRAQPEAIEHVHDY